MSAPLLIVGYGQRGSTWGSVVGRARAAQVVAVADPDAGARAAAEAKGHIAFPTVEEALANGPPVAAAIVASPPAVHAEQAVSCLGAGLAVLVEKPFALSVEDAAAVADAAAAAGRHAVAGHNFRHRPVERALRGALAAGRIGPLRAASIATARPAYAPTFEMPDHAALWDLAVHHVDLLRLRFGGLPHTVETSVVEVSGTTTYSTRLTWEDRAVADHWLCEGASVHHHSEWLEGPGGALRALDGRASVVQAGRRPRRLRPPRGREPEALLLDVLLGSSAVGFDAADAVETIAIVEAMVQSLAVERPVRPEGVR